MNSPPVVADLSKLPPLEELRPDELKNFNREELIAYLQSVGVPASLSDTKPALKQMLRQVLSEIEKKKAGIAADGESKVVITTISPADFAQESKMCEDCGSKKANKECLFNRCKACCLARGFQCSIHIREGQRDYSKEAAIRAERKIGLSNNIQSTPLSSSSRTPLISPSPSFYKQGTSGSISTPLSSSNASLLSNNGVPLSYRQVPTSIQTIEPPPKVVKYVTCPKCQSIVPLIGSNFFTHLSKCDSNYLNSVFTNKNESYLFEETWKDDPENTFETIKRNARERYNFNMECLHDLFSNDETVDDIWDSIKRMKTIDGEVFRKRIRELESEIEHLQNRRMKKDKIENKFEKGHKK